MTNPPPNQARQDHARIPVVNQRTETLETEPEASAQPWQGRIICGGGK